MPRVGCHSVQELYSLPRLRCILQYSTSASSTLRCQSHFIVDYLINELGFSREEAISASTKVNRLKSTKNPDLVLNFFRQCGLEDTVIRNMVSASPALLSSKVDKTLEPKVRVLQDLGLSGSDLGKVISVNPCYFSRGLSTHIIPSLNSLKEVLGNDENVAIAIKKSRWLLAFNAAKNMMLNLSLLRGYGFSDEKIRKLIVKSPGYVMQKPEWLADILTRVEEELGIPRDSAMFSYGIGALASISRSTLEKKFEIFRSFGWSDSDLITMARILPYCLSLSEAKIRIGLNYFMKELGCTPVYLANRPKLLMHSLGKRVIPRNEVLKALREQLLLKSKISLYSVVCLPEAKFVKDFVLPYKDEMPDMFEAYISNMGLQRKIKELSS